MTPPPLESVRARGRVGHRAPRYAVAAVAAATATVAAGLVAGTDSLLAEPAEPGRGAATAADPVPTGAPAACRGPLPLDVRVPGSSDVVDGPAPGRDPARRGQVVRHWPRPEGAVEVRWPASPQPLYGAAEEPAGTVTVGISSGGGTTAVDVHRSTAAGVEGDPPGVAARPDVVLERVAAAGGDGRAGCDVVELTIDTGAGTWVQGVVLPAEEGIRSLQFRDLQPRVVERRRVASAPAAVVACEQPGHPSRSSAARGSRAHPQPVDVLVHHLRDSDGWASSGYVELTLADGSVVYGAPAADRPGWTALLAVERTAGGWHSTGWTASGC